MLLDPLPGWTPSVEPQRLLVAGATGRFGEALLNEAIARRTALGFKDVVALGESRAALSLGLSGLSMAPLEALPPVTAAIVSLSDPQDDGARSFHGRDAPFMLVDTLRVQSVAAAAIAAGAQRLVLVHPLPAWQQLSGLHQGLVGEVELHLSRLPCPSMLMIRPVAHSRSAGGNWLARFARGYLSLQMLMMPRSLAVLTSSQLARAIVGQLQAPARPGIGAMGAPELQDWLERQAQSRT
jgi:hypothetical protein